MASKSARLKVLILYTKVGGGHESIAQGLKERIEEQYPGSLVTLLDPISSWMDVSYRASTLVSSDIFNLIHSLMRHPYVITISKQLNELIHGLRIQDYIKKEKPTIIISTYFLFTKGTRNSNVPSAVYIADPFDPHLIWLDKSVDLYLSFDKEHLSEKFMALLPEKIIPIGMPIRRAFYEKYSRTETHKNLGFDPNKFTIFFGGSGSGMDRLERIATRFIDLELPVQAFFLCGRNKMLQKGLEVLFRHNPKVKVFGYVSSKEVAVLMQASDIFVGKVGPNAMFETILSGLPVIATPPILAQEKGNRVFIKEMNTGFLSSNTDETLSLIKKVVKNPSNVTQLKITIEEVRADLLKREREGLPQFMQWIETKLEGSANATKASVL